MSSPREHGVRAKLVCVSVKAREPVGARRWILHLLVYPCVVLAATLAVELFGVPGLVILAPAVAVWTWTLVRFLRRDRRLIGPKLGFLALTVFAIMILRPASPGRLPNDLAEVLLRELLEDASDEIYYIEVDGQDPSPDLLRRLADLGVRLKPRSMAMIGGPDYPREEFARSISNNVKDRDTGEYGTVLSVGNLDRDRAYIVSLTVDIGYYMGTLAAEGRRCLVMHLGRWRITGATMWWAS